MPTDADKERLEALAQAKRSRQNEQVHVSVHVGDEKKQKTWVHHVAESPWSKIAAALLLGAGGGEGHRLLSPTGLVQRSDLDDMKKDTAREFGREDGKIDETGRALAAKTTLCEERADRDERELYALGRYLYFVLPKTGVLVTLPEGTDPPRTLDFHPAPLLGTVTPSGAKPIQPAETFPLPLKAE